ncbi:MAG: DNA repair protein RadC [Cyclobacteriaceae bacterium]|nr:DNA repair protein RadC [Cyclobacteriaceae bacterium]
MAENFKISQWAREDRPREKLILRGAKALSTAELLATLIGSGNGKFSALDLARQVLKYCDNDLSRLAGLEYHDLVRFSGIGPARAVALVSAMEITRRRKNPEQRSKIKITGSNDVYHCMQDYLLDQKIETFWVLYLNRAHHLLHRQLISQGGVSGTLVDPKLVFKHALDHLASALIVVHNHPSGQLRPSEADRKLTDKLAEAGRIMEIPVLDHLIFSNSGYFSFADEALI